MIRPLACLLTAAPLMALLPAVAVAQSAPRGQILFLQCRSCHSLDAKGPSKVGPDLKKLFTRPALGAAGFKYSAAFTAEEPVWTAASLDRWLTRPSGMIKGTSMAFGGVAKPEDRATLIAWLKTTTK